jgi:hypothetical protein
VVDEHGEAVPVPEAPGLDYHEELYVLSGYLIGEDGIDAEIDAMVAEEGPEETGLVLAELRRVLADPAIDDGELDEIVDNMSPYKRETARSTLEYIAARMARTLGQATPGQSGMDP